MLRAYDKVMIRNPHQSSHFNNPMPVLIVHRGLWEKVFYRISYGGHQLHPKYGDYVFV